MDLTTTAGIAEWVTERMTTYTRNYANGYIPLSAYTYNVNRLLDLAKTCELRLNITDRPVRALTLVKD